MDLRLAFAIACGSLTACGCAALRVGAPPPPAALRGLDDDVTPLALVGDGPAWQQGEGEGEGELPRHTVLLFGGVGAEDKLFGSPEYDFAVGLGYIHRLSPLVGLGFGVEALGPRVERELLVGAPLSFYPWQELRLAVGPAMEFASGERSWALRVGAGYEFELGGGWSLAPELFYDFLERGERTLVTGVSLSRSW